MIPDCFPLRTAGRMHAEICLVSAPSTSADVGKIAGAWELPNNGYRPPGATSQCLQTRMCYRPGTSFPSSLLRNALSREIPSARTGNGLAQSVTRATCMMNPFRRQAYRWRRREGRVAGNWASRANARTVPANSRTPFPAALVAPDRYTGSKARICECGGHRL